MKLGCILKFISATSIFGTIQARCARGMQTMRKNIVIAIIITALISIVPVVLAEVIFLDDFSTDLGWSGYGTENWERGAAVISSGCSYGTDPAVDHTDGEDQMLLGFAIGDCYLNNLPATAITSPVIDCSAHSGVQLRFYRVLGVEKNECDHATIQVFDGTNWIEIYHNPAGVAIRETDWSQQLYDISSYADGNPNFQIRFTMGPTDHSVDGCGWNIDDLEVYVLDPFCVQVEPSSSTTGASQDSVAIHPVTLINCGTETDEIILSVSGNTWPTIITDQSGLP
ncbi:hypothetical protein K8T06_03240, partial [bacterium]|nr:hypothetical protein [bacterium]